MGILSGLLQAGITVVAIILIMVVLAGLFMIVFQIAAGIDDHIAD